MYDYGGNVTTNNLKIGQMTPKCAVRNLFQLFLFVLRFFLSFSSPNLCFISDTRRTAERNRILLGSKECFMHENSHFLRVVNSLKDEYFEFLSQCKLDVSGRMGNHKVIKECRPKESKLILPLLNYLMHIECILTYGCIVDKQSIQDDKRYFVLA